MIEPLPEKLLLSRRDILAGSTGVTEYMLKQAIASGKLKRHKFGKYHRTEVIRAFGLSRELAAVSD